MSIKTVKRVLHVKTNFKETSSPKKSSNNESESSAKLNIGSPSAPENLESDKSGFTIDPNLIQKLKEIVNQQQNNPSADQLVECGLALVEMMENIKTSKSEKIEICTDNEKDYIHHGYKRADGRSIIYERRDDVEKQLARYNYTVPHEKGNKKKSLKSDCFFTDKWYGETVSKTWNFIFYNKDKSVKQAQSKIDQIFQEAIENWQEEKQQEEEEESKDYRIIENWHDNVSEKLPRAKHYSEIKKIDFQGLVKRAERMTDDHNNHDYLIKQSLLPTEKISTIETVIEQTKDIEDYLFTIPKIESSTKYEIQQALNEYNEMIILNPTIKHRYLDKIKDENDGVESKLGNLEDLSCRTYNSERKEFCDGKIYYHQARDNYYCRKCSRKLHLSSIAKNLIDENRVNYRKESLSSFELLERYWLEAQAMRKLLVKQIKYAQENNNNDLVIKLIERLHTDLTIDNKALPHQYYRNVESTLKQYYDS